MRTGTDLIAYMRDLKNKGQFTPMGRMNKIAVGPSDAWPGAGADPYLRKFGRLLELRDQFLPIAKAGECILVTAPLVMADGRVGLPDVPEPDWVAPVWTEDEITRKVERPAAKGQAPMIPQRLTDRCEHYQGRPAVLEGSNFLIFQPVLRVEFQPELENRLMPTAWLLDFYPVNGKHTAFLVDHLTGDCYFYGGRWDLSSAPGESTGRWQPAMAAAGS